jgi:hypothetical protein
MGMSPNHPESQVQEAQHSGCETAHARGGWPGCGWLSTALVVALGTVVGLFLVWRGGEWALRELVFENHSFAVRTIQSKEKVIRAEEILRWSGVRREGRICWGWIWRG